MLGMHGVVKSLFDEISFYFMTGERSNILYLADDIKFQGERQSNSSLVMQKMSAYIAYIEIYMLELLVIMHFHQ